MHSESPVPLMFTEERVSPWRLFDLSPNLSQNVSVTPRADETPVNASNPPAKPPSSGAGFDQTDSVFVRVGALAKKGRREPRDATPCRRTVKYLAIEADQSDASFGPPPATPSYLEPVSYAPGQGQGEVIRALQAYAKAMGRRAPQPAIADGYCRALCEPFYLISTAQEAKGGQEVCQRPIVHQHNEFRSGKGFRYRRPDSIGELPDDLKGTEYSFGALQWLQSGNRLTGGAQLNPLDSEPSVSSILNAAGCATPETWAEKLLDSTRGGCRAKVAL